MFPQWEARELDEIVPMFDDKAKDLLLVSVGKAYYFKIWLYFHKLSNNSSETLIQV